MFSGSLQDFVYITNGDAGPSGEEGPAEDTFHDALDTSFKSDAAALGAGLRKDAEGSP